VDAFISELQKNQFDLILLDHDLGGEVYVDINRDDTGSGAARWIKQNLGETHPIVITHTLNQAGADNILLLIDGSIHVPFLWGKEVFHQVIK
jgi:CheY-like chemotaxis protein